MELDITNKAKKVKIVSKVFTPEGGQPVQYKQLVLEVVINGNLTPIPFKLNADKALVLESIPEPDETKIV